MNSQIQRVLLALLAEVENLQANQAVLAQAATSPQTIAEARETKDRALREARKSLGKLRKQIGELA